MDGQTLLDQHHLPVEDPTYLPDSYNAQIPNVVPDEVVIIWGPRQAVASSGLAGGDKVSALEHVARKDGAESRQQFGASGQGPVALLAYGLQAFGRNSWIPDRRTSSPGGSLRGRCFQDGIVFDSSAQHADHFAGTRTTLSDVDRKYLTRLAKSGKPGDELSVSSSPRMD